VLAHKNCPGQKDPIFDLFYRGADYRSVFMRLRKAGCVAMARRFNILRVEDLRGADEEEVEGAGGALEEAAADVDELKRKLREKKASEARLMAASRDRSREDSHAQSKIDHLIRMFSTLAARQQPGSVHIASLMATAPPVGMPSRSVEDGADYSEYTGMKALETHEIFEATMSTVAVKKRGDAQFATAHSAWRR
jgi:hypothetical protein